MVSPTYKEIIKSINELDEIGLEHFLEKYNFRPNIKYALIYNEKPYPPKALWFRALERELPEKEYDPKWRKQGFGAPQIQYLRSIGFEVEDFTKVIKNNSLNPKQLKILRMLGNAKKF